MPLDAYDGEDIPVGPKDSKVGGAHDELVKQSCSVDPCRLGGTFRSRANRWSSSVEVAGRDEVADATPSRQRVRQRAV